MRDENMSGMTRPSIATIMWTLLAALFLLKIMLPLVTQTMFFDGLIYASISRNIAEGVGSTLNPQFSETAFPAFFEHPPLMFWFESIAFRLLGDHLWIEKSYSLFWALLSGLVFLGIWKRINRNDPELQTMGAVPMIMALISGRVGWAFSNNMLENLLTAFTSVAIYLVLIAYERPTRLTSLNRLIIMAVAGIAVGLALLTKGPVGLFPLSAPGLYWIVFRKHSFTTAFLDSIVLLAATVAVIAFVALFPEPRSYMMRYLDGQLLSSLAGSRGGTGGGLKGLISLVRVNSWSIAITLVFVALSALLTRGSQQGQIPSAEIVNRRLKNGIFLFLVGISASLPLLLSPRINNFYFNPSILYFAMALAFLCVPSLLQILKKVKLCSLRWTFVATVGLLVLSIVLVGLKVGQEGADRDIIIDARKIAAAVCGDDVACAPVVSVCAPLWSDWQLHGYMQRNHKISLEALPISEAIPARQYLIADDTCLPDAPSGYRQKDIGLSMYRLLEK